MSTRVITASWFLISLFLIVGPGPAGAHGVRGEYAPGGIVVTANYSDGKPMSYARVDIRAPGGGPTFQSGRTDRNGRFCFYPDGPGQWTVVVNDEIGHRLELAVPSDKQGGAPARVAGHSTARNAPVWMRTVAGIGVILGLCGIAMMWRSRKKERPEKGWQEENEDACK